MNESNELNKLNELNLRLKGKTGDERTEQIE